MTLKKLGGGVQPSAAIRALMETPPERRWRHERQHRSRCENDHRPGVSGWNHRGLRNRGRSECGYRLRHSMDAHGRWARADRVGCEPSDRMDGRRRAARADRGRDATTFTRFPAGSFHAGMGRDGKKLQGHYFDFRMGIGRLVHERSVGCRGRERKESDGGRSNRLLLKGNWRKPTAQQYAAVTCRKPLAQNGINQAAGKAVVV